MFAHFVSICVRLVLAVGLGEDLARGPHPSPEAPLLLAEVDEELADELFPLYGREPVYLRDGRGQLLDAVLVQVLHDLRGHLRPQGDQEGRGPLNAAHVKYVFHVSTLIIICDQAPLPPGGGMGHKAFYRITGLFISYDYC